MLRDRLRFAPSLRDTSPRIAPPNSPKSAWNAFGLSRLFGIKNAERAAPGTWFRAYRIVGRRPQKSESCFWISDLAFAHSIGG